MGDIADAASADEIRLAAEKQPKWLVLIWVFVGLSTTAQLVHLVSNGRPWHAYIWPGVIVALFMWNLVLLRRPPQIVVNAAGVKAPMKKRIPWSDVEAVQQQSVYEYMVVLLMKDGTRTETRIPREYTDDVARISGLPVVPRPSVIKK
ncbi:hypothetical protein [Yimella sp. cx-51]|uniref:hypothetical protein n=1 Tax=Yimella sp. cx-51 TaxID=2770551 RepID=UPI00165DEBDA|nr:hypothetical protein [Yimella sp. cx-51]MBC9957628.1 hypothetical protein [Yimella sp. cx-51]QTH37013.1 hypothetical protein J5M86_08755 [Yimella sp. cx-51]